MCSICRIPSPFTGVLSIPHGRKQSQMGEYPVRSVGWDVLQNWFCPNPRWTFVEAQQLFPKCFDSSSDTVQLCRRCLVSEWLTHCNQLICLPVACLWIHLVTPSFFCGQLWPCLRQRYTPSPPFSVGMSITGPKWTMKSVSSVPIPTSILFRTFVGVFEEFATHVRFRAAEKACRLVRIDISIGVQCHVD